LTVRKRCRTGTATRFDGDRGELNRPDSEGFRLSGKADLPPPSRTRNFPLNPKYPAIEHGVQTRSAPGSFGQPALRLLSEVSLQPSSGRLRLGWSASAVAAIRETRGERDELDPVVR
jgi:hypothetical protein